MWKRQVRARQFRKSVQRRFFRPAAELLEDRRLLATFNVTTAADNGAGSLRQAILDANSTPGADNIFFGAGTGTQTINLVTALPTVTGPVVIDGTTQPGFGGVPLIELNGTNAEPGANGLRISAGNSTVRGLVINRFQGHGIWLETNGNNRIEGNYIGTSRSGTVDEGNSLSGIHISGGSPFNTIGGTTAAQRNVISGNDSHGIEIRGTSAVGIVSTTIQGNYIGTDATGTAALGNAVIGIEAEFAHDSTIGGTAAGARNVISANTSGGVRLLGVFRWTIQGNHVGTNVAGTAFLGTQPIGVFLGEASVVVPTGCVDVIIGGTTGAARNVITAGSGSAGILLSDYSERTVIQGNFIGLNVDGTGLVGGGSTGIQNHGPRNTIGGTTAAARNIIAGFTTGISTFGSFNAGTLIQGNYIGTNAAGTAALPNTFAGIDASGASVMIGGTAPGAGNLISGNTTYGITAQGATGVTMQGNRIGTTADGSAPLANGTGVYLSGAGHVVGGSTAGAGNLISGNATDGIRIDGNIGSGAQAIQILGNLIGTNAPGAAAIPNVGTGITILGGTSSDTTLNVVGGTTPAAGNVISGNGVGIKIMGARALAQTIQGNRIGTTAAGTVALGNSSHGVWITDASSSNVIGGVAAGAGNVIAHNGGDGIFADSGTANTFRGNSLFANAGLGIDLGPNGVTPNDTSDGDTGANNLLNFPELTSATTTFAGTTVVGTLKSLANSTFTLDFYSSDTADASSNGEGRTYLGSRSVTTNGGGNANFTQLLPFLPPPGHVITATTTDSAGSTSEFSVAVPAQRAETDPPTVTSIVRLNPAAALTNGATVIYRVTFSEPVNGISAADFTPVDVSNSITGEAVDAVSGASGTVIDVTVRTGIVGEGDMRLDVIAPGATITDDNGNDLVTSYTTGDVYTIDHTRPTVTSISRLPGAGQVTNASSVIYRVAFQEPVFGVSTADFTLFDVDGTISGESITAVSAESGSVIDVTVNTGSSGSGNLRLDVVAAGATIADQSGNALAADFTGGEVYTIDRAAPLVASIVRLSPTGPATNAATATYRVTFSEPVNNVSIADFKLVDVASAISGESITSVSAASGSVIDVVVNTGTAGDGDLRLDVEAPAATIADDAGNPFAGSFTGGQVFTLDRTGPVVASIVRLAPASPATNASAVTYRVNFSEPVNGVSVADFTLVDIANAISGESITSVSAASGAVIDVTVSTGTAGDGDLRLDVVASAATITDDLGNALGTSFTAGQVFTLDRTAPSAPAILSISQDTGASAADRITNDTTLVVSGSAESNSSVTLTRVGTGVIGTATANALGEWSFDYTGTSLAAGNHEFTATATDVPGNTSVASAAFTVLVDLAAPPAPTILGVGSDTGSSAADAITSDKTLIVSGAAEATATVTLSLVGIGVLGSVTADAAGAWSFDYSGTVLTDGNHRFTATATDVAGNVSGISAAFRVLIYTTWRNPVDPLDTDSDTFISPIDAVLIINLLNFAGDEILKPLAEQNLPGPLPFYDADGDGFASPIDAVLVINYLNTHDVTGQSAVGEGESGEQLSAEGPSEGELDRAFAEILAELIDCAQRTGVQSDRRLSAVRAAAFSGSFPIRQPASFSPHLRAGSSQTSGNADGDWSNHATPPGIEGELIELLASAMDSQPGDRAGHA